MKGISAIVVTILLVLISISLIGFVYIFFTNTASSATTTATNTQNQIQQNLAKVAAIDNVAGTALVVRNGGSAALAAADLTVYVNGLPVTCTGAGWTPASFITGQTSTCTLPAACSGTGATAIKVTAPGGIATTTC